MAPDSKTIRIGVLFEHTQMTDLAGLDVIGNLSTRIFDLVVQVNPAISGLRNLYSPMEFLYIASSLEPAWTSPEMYVKPTHT